MTHDVGVFKTDVATLKSDVVVLKTDVATLKFDVSVLKTDVSNNTKSLLANRTNFQNSLKQLAHGGGIQLERLSAAWVKEVLTKQGFPLANPLLHYKVKDPLRVVHPANTEFEIDVIVFEPFLLMECTSVVCTLDKLEKFIWKSDYLEQSMGRKAIKYFAFYHASDALEDKLKTLAEANNVKLITGNDFCRDY